jgi:hypothetical protein
VLRAYGRAVLAPRPELAWSTYMSATPTCPDCRSLPHVPRLPGVFPRPRSHAQPMRAPSVSATDSTLAALRRAAPQPAHRTAGCAPERPPAPSHQSPRPPTICRRRARPPPSSPPPRSSPGIARCSAVEDLASAVILVAPPWPSRREPSNARRHPRTPNVGARARTLTRSPSSHLGGVIPCARPSGPVLAPAFNDPAPRATPLYDPESALRRTRRRRLSSFALPPPRNALSLRPWRPPRAITVYPSRRVAALLLSERQMESREPGWPLPAAPSLTGVVEVAAPQSTGKRAIALTFTRDAAHDRSAFLKDSVAYLPRRRPRRVPGPTARVTSPLHGPGPACEGAPERATAPVFDARPPRV